MVKILVWEVSLHTKLHVSPIDTDRVIWAIQYAYDRSGYLVQVSLICVEAMIDHEQNDRQDLLRHWDLVEVLKAHDTSLLDQVFFAEFFHAVESSADVPFSRLERIVERLIVDLFDQFLTVGL